MWFRPAACDGLGAHQLKCPSPGQAHPARAQSKLIDPRQRRDAASRSRQIPWAGRNLAVLGRERILAIFQGITDEEDGTAKP